MNKTAERIFAVFFVGIFSLVALGLIWFLGNRLFLHQTAMQWQQVPAEILNWEIARGSGKKSGSKLVVRYRYAFQGKTYTGSRVDFSLGSDNFSGGRRRRQMNLLEQKPVQVYVNPAAPAESVLDRSLPVQQIAFGLVFLVFPCGLGTVFMLSYLLQGVQRLSGWKAERFTFPLLGLLHSYPAPYTLLADSPDRGLGSGLILFLFTLLLGYSLYECLRRIQDPQHGLNGLTKRFPKGVPAVPKPIKRTVSEQ